MQYVTDQELYGLLRELIPFWFFAGVFGAIAYGFAKDLFQVLLEMFGEIVFKHPKLAALREKHRQNAIKESEHFLIHHPFLLTKRQTALNEEVKRLNLLQTKAQAKATLHG